MQFWRQSRQVQLGHTSHSCLLEREVWRELSGRLLGDLWPQATEGIPEGNT